MTAAGWLVCGVDEAGRGPLAGPVYAAAVVLGERMDRTGLADSKTLTAAARERLRHRIQTHAAAWSIASASAQEIDQLNILRATLLAMQRAVEGLKTIPAEVLVDGSHCPRLRLPVRAVVRGDATVAEIAAASILAKTERDRRMIALEELYPGYGFAKHKGYPTKDHMTALMRLGPTPEHRLSFAPVRTAPR